MGQRQSQTKLIPLNEREASADSHINTKKNNENIKMTKNHFEFQYIIGRGGFGRVWKVILKKNKKIYAIKEMYKAKVIDKRSEKSIMYERDLLTKLKHSFIVNLHFAFQDFENLYLVLDYLHGGDLRYHISRQKRFSEEQVKFFIACLLLSFEYIHGHNILHRDIKPENMVIDDKGYVRITDFGIAKLYTKDNSSETSGTPGYMAPEVMCGQNHTIAVDYFALGVFGYEFMNGRRPYLGNSRKEIKEQIMLRQAIIKKSDIPQNWSIESADFINKCLQRKPACRLGLRGINEAKEHPWFKDYPWKEHYNKKIPSPFFSKLTDNFDKNYSNSEEKIGIETKARYQAFMQDYEFPDVFKKFTYCNINELGNDLKKNINEKEKIIMERLSHSKSVNLRVFNNPSINNQRKSDLSVSKSIRNKIKLSPSAITSNKIKEFEINEKDKLLIDAALSVVYDDKKNKDSKEIRSSSIGLGKEYHSYVKKELNQYSNKFPDIESKIDIINKISNASTLNILSSRNSQTRGIKKEILNYDNGIRKITPTKLISKGISSARESHSTIVQRNGVKINNIIKRENMKK